MMLSSVGRLGPWAPPLPEPSLPGGQDVVDDLAGCVAGVRMLAGQVPHGGEVVASGDQCRLPVAVAPFLRQRGGSPQCVAQAPATRGVLLAAALAGDVGAGRRCLCNALLAAAALPQERRNGYREPALVTAGDDFSAVRHLAGEHPDSGYTAREVVDHILSPG